MDQLFVAHFNLNSTLEQIWIIFNFFMKSCEIGLEILEAEVLRRDFETPTRNQLGGTMLYICNSRVLYMQQYKKGTFSLGFFVMIIFDATAEHHDYVMLLFLSSTTH